MFILAANAYGIPGAVGGGVLEIPRGLEPGVPPFPLPISLGKPVVTGTCGGTK